MFYKWKATTAKIIIKRLKPTMTRTRIPIDLDVMKFLVDEVFHVLGVWKSPGQDAACDNELKIILQAAIDFDSYVHEEWSNIFIAATPVGFDHPYGFKFNDHSMRPAGSRELESGEPVGTVISPALIRKGTSSGDQYNEVQEILVHSRVLSEGFSAKTQKPRNAQNGGIVSRSGQQRMTRA